MLELLLLGISICLVQNHHSDGNMIDNEIAEDNRHRMHFVFIMESKRYFHLFCIHANGMFSLMEMERKANDPLIILYLQAFGPIAFWLLAILQWIFMHLCRLGVCVCARAEELFANTWWAQRYSDNDVTKYFHFGILVR